MDIANTVTPRFLQLRFITTPRLLQEISVHQLTFHWKQSKVDSIIKTCNPRLLDYYKKI